MNVNSVHSDNISGAIAVAELFADLGHKKIAYFTTGAGRYRTYEIRKEAFLHGLLKRGISDCVIHDSHYFYEKTFINAREFFKNNEMPEAIFSSGDESTLAIIDAMSEIGAIAGRDVSVVGFYAPGMQYKAYDITCLKQDTLLMAQDVVDMVYDLVENPNQTIKTITRPMSLYIGKSTITRM